VIVWREPGILAGQVIKKVLTKKGVFIIITKKCNCDAIAIILWESVD